MLPENIGFRAGPSDSSMRWLEVQIHYDNPNSHTGIVDNSGVRIYYTDQLRQYDAGKFFPANFIFPPKNSS